MKISTPLIAWAITLILVLTFAPRAKADTLRPTAIQAAVADTATTAVALSLPNVVEANPAGFVGTIIGKVVVLSLADGQDAKTKKQIEHVASAAWTGAAANNLMIILGAVSAALPVGIATGVYLLFSGDEDDDKQIAVLRKDGA